MECFVVVDCAAKVNKLNEKMIDARKPTESERDYLFNI